MLAQSDSSGENARDWALVTDDPEMCRVLAVEFSPFLMPVGTMHASDAATRIAAAARGFLERRRVLSRAVELQRSAAHAPASAAECSSGRPLTIVPREIVPEGSAAEGRLPAAEAAEQFDLESLIQVGNPAVESLIQVGNPAVETSAGPPPGSLPGGVDLEAKLAAYDRACQAYTEQHGVDGDGVDAERETDYDKFFDSADDTSDSEDNDPVGWRPCP